MGIQHGQNGAGAPSAERPSYVEGRLARDTRELLAAIERLSDDAGRSLRDQVDRRPYRLLGLGLLGGYVLGRGLTVRLGQIVLAAAVRAALADRPTSADASVPCYPKSRPFAGHVGLRA